MHENARLFAPAAWLLLLVAAFSARAAGADEQEEANTRAVLEFYELAINRKDFDAAEKYLGPYYIQHNPSAADGKEGLKRFIGYLREAFPAYRSEIKRHFADGDYVVLHIHNKPTPESPSRAVVDIFRLEQGKVVEHWDVIQPVPENPANDNTMF